MNKKNIFLVSIIILLFAAIVGIINIQIKKNKEDSNYQPFTYLPTLNFNQFKTLYDNKDEFYVYIGRPDCGDSRQFENEFAKYFVDFDKEGNFVQLRYDLGDNPFYYFDVSEIIESTKSIEQRKTYKSYGFYYTPSLIHYKEGKVVNIAEWDPVFGFDVTDYLKWFYDNQLIASKDEVYHKGPTDRND
ncbi:thiol-disulfide isomerase [Mycoplasmatota bacterium]|nr:thiol-disulfide isomerase [Mycoplasmatota bacterium]